MNVSLPFHPKNPVLVIAVLLSAAGIAGAAQPQAPKRTIATDAHLSVNRTWRGTVVTTEGLAIPHARLELTSGNHQRPALYAITNDQGCFQFESVHPGTYLLRCGDDVRIYRLWHNGTAPPSADHGTLIVIGDTVSRGNLYDWASSHPILTYGGIATAIAVPTAVIGSAQERSPASP